MCICVYVPSCTGHTYSPSMFFKIVAYCNFVPVPTGTSYPVIDWPYFLINSM